MLRGLILSFFLVTTGQAASLTNLMLWYQQPATNALTDALPIGNGSLGAMIFGDPNCERLVISEDSLWTGNANSSGDLKSLGSYQFFGDALIHLSGQTNYSKYRRELDLNTALASTEYFVNGVHYHREIFCSHPAGAIVMRFSSDKPGSFSGFCELKDSHGAMPWHDGNNLVVQGILPNGEVYEWRLEIVATGGNLFSLAEQLQFKDCDELTFIITAGTDYAPDAAREFHGEDPHQRLKNVVEKAATNSFGGVLTEHLKDYQKLFDRVEIDLGHSSARQRTLPTDLRKITAAEDPELLATLFQYGRYLLISSSREDGLPSFSQGIWNNTNHGSDVLASGPVASMNYWPAETANLGESVQPLVASLPSQIGRWEAQTVVAPELETPQGDLSTRGFALRVSRNIYGGMGGTWDNTSPIWLCHDLWQHYRYSPDKNFLQNEAYPLLKLTTEFWLDHLKQTSNGIYLAQDVVGFNHSSENDGNAYLQSMVWELFDDFASAEKILGRDIDLADIVINARDQLALPKFTATSLSSKVAIINQSQPNKFIGSSNPAASQYPFEFAGIYPGHWINSRTNMNFLASARAAMRSPGRNVSSELGWNAALAARMNDATQAVAILQEFLSPRNSNPNLFGKDAHVEQTVALTAAMCEMLVQSDEQSVSLLPALPTTWPSGSVSGLRLVGDRTLALTWSDGKLSEARLSGEPIHDLTVYYGGKSVLVNSKGTNDILLSARSFH